MPVNEDVIGAGRAAHDQIGFQRFQRGVAQTYESILQTFGLFDAHATILPIDVGQLHVAHFAGA